MILQFNVNSASWFIKRTLFITIFFLPSSILFFLFFYDNVDAVKSSGGLMDDLQYV